MMYQVLPIGLRTAQQLSKFTKFSKFSNHGHNTFNCGLRNLTCGVVCPRQMFGPRLSSHQAPAVTMGATSTLRIRQQGLVSLGSLPKFHNQKQSPFSFRFCQTRNISEDRETTALTVWSNVKELKSSPIPALVYGFSGLIPFMSVPAYMTMSQLYFPQMAFAQLAYGATILSFLGGVRWGFVIPNGSAHRPSWFNLGYSVTPPLVAWVGLLLPDPLSAACVMVGLAGSAYFDTAVPGYPAWFKGLRFVLSIVAVLALWSTFMCKCLLQSADNQQVKGKE